MILMIDNYDSFVFNLVRYCQELGEDVCVWRNDQITLGEIEIMAPDYIMISPGPGYPKDAGLSMEIIRQFGGKIPLLGICLGHQAIGQVFGAKVVRAAKPIHGKVEAIYHNSCGLFHQLPSPMLGTRYHSLVVEPTSLPPDLIITAQSSTGEIMGLAHRNLAIAGVQFHPESVLSEHGHLLLGNFLKGR